MSEHPRLVVVCLLAAAAACARAAPVRACAACSCGDPTLTVMGTEQPFAGRLRLSLELLHRNDAFAEGAERHEVSEQRATLALAYAPTPRLMLSAALPLVRREVSRANLAKDTMVSPGDAVLRGRWFVLRDRALAPRHLLAVVLGMRFPTAPLLRAANGDYFEPELQPGTGSFDPLAGVSYSYFADPWSLYLSEVAYVSTQSRADWRIGTSLRGSHIVQYQLHQSIAVRAGANFRLEQKTVRQIDGAQVDEPDTGGFVLFAMPSVVWSPLMDLTVYLDVNIPVVNALVGTHDEGVIATLGAAYDL